MCIFISISRHLGSIRGWQVGSHTLGFCFVTMSALIDQERLNYCGCLLGLHSEWDSIWSRFATIFLRIRILVLRRSVPGLVQEDVVLRDHTDAWTMTRVIRFLVRRRRQTSGVKKMMSNSQAFNNVLNMKMNFASHWFCHGQLATSFLRNPEILKQIECGVRPIVDTEAENIADDNAVNNMW